MQREKVLCCTVQEGGEVLCRLHYSPREDREGSGERLKDPPKKIGYLQGGEGRLAAELTTFQKNRTKTGGKVCKETLTK